MARSGSLLTKPMTAIRCGKACGIVASSGSARIRRIAFVRPHKTAGRCGWLGNFRRLVVRYDRSLQICRACFPIACFMIVLRTVLQ
jgi:hypothetical protein